MPSGFNYVVAAYMAIWTVLIVYLFTIGSRLSKAEKQISLLESKKK